MVPGVGSVAMGIGVKVAVGVAVAVPGAVAVTVAVGVAVAVCVAVAVDVGALIRVAEVVGTFVFWDGGCGVEVGIQISGIKVLVRPGMTSAVSAIVAGTVGATGLVAVVRGKGVPVTKNAPGVRKTLIQAGWVRMDASTGSIGPPEGRVRKALFGSIWDSISVFSFQMGEKRSAHCPARTTHRNPTTRMMEIMIQSCRSRSGVFIAGPVDRQSHKDRCAGIVGFIVSRAFEPDAPAMSIDNPACDGKPETRSPTFELGLARGM